MGTLVKLISTQNFIFQGSEDCKCYILHNTRRVRENHLKVAVWFSWWEGHWNWKEITRVSSDVKFHATTFVWCVDDWQLPLKYGMLVIIVVFPINFSYNWSTDTMPAINPQWQHLEIRVSSSSMGRHWLIPRPHLGPEMSQPKYLILLSLLQQCTKLPAIFCTNTSFQDIFLVKTFCCNSKGWYFVEISPIQAKTTRCSQSFL